MDADGRPVYYEGFRIRYGSIDEDRPFEPCIDPGSGRMKYLKRQGNCYIQFCLTVDAFRRLIMKLCVEKRGSPKRESKSSWVLLRRAILLLILVGELVLHEALTTSGRTSILTSTRLYAKQQIYSGSTATTC